MWAISASPLVVTTPIMNCSARDGPNAAVSCKGWISELQKKILLNTEVLAINQDVTPQGRPIHQGELSLWSRKLSDGSFAVAMYNEEDAPKALAVEFADLGFSPDKKVRVRDLWAKEDQGVFTKSFPASGSPGMRVAPHATRLFRITPVSA
jgi:alpha-galactosidase